MTTCRTAPDWCQISGVNPPVADRPKGPRFNWKRGALEGMLTSGSLSGANA
jgi:hypothetical protein